jgi:hypothetical protein
MAAAIRRVLDDADRFLTRLVKPPRPLHGDPARRDRVVTVELVQERRSADPINRLSRRVDGACRRALDAHEIAASLEAEGLNDRLAQERFAHPDVFSLATEIHQRVPLRPVIAETESGRLGIPQPRTAALVMRGPIYLLPILYFFASPSLADHSNLAWVALPAVAAAWMWNQGFGVLTHRLIGRGDLPGAHRMARWSLAAGTGLIGMFGWLAGTALFHDPWLGWFATGQTAYLIGSASLVTFARDRILMLALAPGTVVATVSVAAGGAAERFVDPMAVLTIGAIVAGTLWVTGDAPTARLSVPSRWEVSLAATHALLGATWAGFIAAAGYAVGTVPDVFTTVSIAAAPMVATMGVAEWRLHRLRRDVRAILARTDEPAVFAHRSREALASGLVAFAAAIGGVAILAAIVAGRAGMLDLDLAVLTAAFVLLGCAFFAGLALASMNRADLALAASAGALLATLCLITMARLRVVEAATADVTGAIAYLTGCLALGAGLVALAHHHVADTVRHR